MSFLDLPEHIVGEIYALIGDSVSRKALLSSCMAVRSSPSVLAQITMLRIQQEQLYNYSGLCHPLASFPAGASLRTLVVHGSLRHYPRDDGAQLCHLLRPDASVDGPLRTRIEQTLLTLQELCLQDFNVLNGAESVQFVSLLQQLCPRLKALHMGDKGFPAQSLVHSALLQGLPALGLSELHLNDRRLLDTQRLGELTTLTALSFNLPIRQSPAPLTPLTSLRSLQHLSICEAEYNAVTNLHEVLPYLPDLTTLSLPEMLDSHQLSLLSPSIQRINLKHVMRLVPLAELLALVASHHFPKFKQINITDLVPYSEQGADMQAFEAAMADCWIDADFKSSVCVNIKGTECSGDMPSCLHCLSCMGGLLASVQELYIETLTLQAEDISRLADLLPHLKDLTVSLDLDLGLHHLQKICLFRDLQKLAITQEVSPSSIHDNVSQLFGVCLAAAFSPAAHPLHISISFGALDEDVPDIRVAVEESWRVMSEGIRQVVRGSRVVKLVVDGVPCSPMP